MLIPEDLRLTAEHEWGAGDGVAGPVWAGVTGGAQDARGDGVVVASPGVGAAAVAGRLPGVVSTGSVSHGDALPAGAVRVCRDRLADTPTGINAAPCGAGWPRLTGPGVPAVVAVLPPLSADRELAVS